MFLRMLVQAAVLRRGRAAGALLAMVVAAAVATAMLTLFSDVQLKLQSEFRSYGANVVLIAKDGQQLPAGATQQVDSALDGHGISIFLSLRHALPLLARTQEASRWLLQELTSAAFGN